MRQIPWASHGSHGATILARDNWSAVGASNVLVRVVVTPRTLVQSAGGMSGLKAGMPVFVGGDFTGRSLTAILIASLQKAPAAAPHQAVGLFHALSGKPMQLPRALRMGATRLRHEQVSNTSNNLNFTGGFGGPSYNYNQDLGDIDIFDVGVVTVYLNHFSFLASLDGWTYNWPFTFTGSTASALTMTEPNSVNLNVLPQPGGNGSYTDTFSGGIGVDIGIGFHIYTIVGCGTLDLESCNFYPTLHLGVGLLNQTQDAAPLDPSQSLNVPSVDCPNVGFSIPDTDISVADVGICNTFLIDGANFSAHASATGASMAPADLSFDGTNGHALALTPTSANVDVTLSNFTWIPTLHYGLHPRIRVVRQTVWTGPTVFITSGAFPMIADAATRAAAGFNDVSGQFAQPSSTDFMFSASKEGTHITYNGPASGDYHDSATLSATLTDNLNRPLSGKTLTFVMNGNSGETCTAATDASGNAQCSITPTDVPALGQVAITFDGDSQYFASSLTPSFSITKEESAVHYTTAVNSQDYHDAAPLSATLTEDQAGPAISGQALTFALGSQGCGSQAATDGTGSAGCTIDSLNQIPSGYTASAAFAGNAYYLPSSDSHAYTITREETTLTYTGDPFIANDRPGTLKALLKEDGSVAPIPAGQTVTLTLGAGGSAQTCTGTVAADGSVSCTLSLVNQALGNNPVSAVFAGDAYYLPSADTTQQRLVFSYLPAGGAFALGNCTVFSLNNCQSGMSTSTLTWWSSQWSALNSLSAGAAPSSFKGFAATASGGDPTCGGTWTTGPGNSASPPSSVPSYTAMVVPTHITKNGATIAGDIAQIVIVKTDAGYAADPGHAGTGTVVGVLCHS